MLKDELINGIANYQNRINKIKEIYLEILDKEPNSSDMFWNINDKQLFNKIILNFVTGLDPQKASGNLMKLYVIALHKKTKSLIIANKGATLFSFTEKNETPHLLRHIGLCVYNPKIGMEYANVGIVGNIYKNKVVLRTESACTPSFLFGSQRCNCYYQWKNVRELAASFNKVKLPKIHKGDEFESWVQTMFTYEDGKHIYNNQSKQGFVMIHIDSQNGMGSGYTDGEFVFDLSERASMRHRGEYSAEQTYKTTMYGGFTCIGINGDPRKANDCAGYNITPIIMDFIKSSKNVIMLTNNPLKISAMENFGYKITRVKSIGAVGIAGSTEASQRGSEFNHLDISGELISFKEDYRRIKKEIKNLIQ